MGEQVNIIKTVLRLQLTLWWRTVRTNPAVLVLAAFLVLYAAGGTIMMCFYIWMDAAEGSLDSLAGAVALGTVAFILLCLAVPSGENQLNPKALAALPLDSSRLVLPLSVGSLLQTRGFIIVVCTTASTICAVVPLSRRGDTVSAVWVIVAMVCAAITTLLLGQAVTSVAGRDRSDRAQKLAGVLTTALVFSSILASSAAEDIYGRVAELGSVLAYTPLAATIGAVSLATVGARATAAVIALVTAILAVVVTAWNISQELRQPLAGNISGASARLRSASVLLRGLPATPLAAVYSATLKTTLRDNRTITSFIFTPAFIIYAVWMYHSQAGDAFYLMAMAGFLTAMTIGSLNSNMFGFDGGASWQILCSGIHPGTWLKGRFLGAATIPAVLLGVYTVIYLVVVGFTSHHLALLCGFIGFGLASTGIAVELSVRAAYPMAPPGTNPWKDRSNGGQAAWISALVVLIGGWVPMIPGFAALWIWHQTALSGILFLVIPAALATWAWRDATGHFAATADRVFAKVRQFIQ